MAMTKKPAVKKPAVKRSGTPVPLAPAPKRTYPRGIAPAPMPARTPRQPAGTIARRSAMPKTSKKAPGKMTPQDKSMKKILEGKYGKIYG